MKRFILNLPIQRLSLILNVASAAFVLLIGLIAILIYQAQKQLEQRYEKRYQSYLLADEIRQSSDDLTRFARLYVITGEPRFKQYYEDILAIQDGKKPRPQNYHRIYWDFFANEKQPPRPDGESIALEELMRQQGFTKEEFDLLQKSKSSSDALVSTEVEAMTLLEMSSSFDSLRESKLAQARYLMHNDAYLAHVADIMNPIDQFYQIVDERTNHEVVAHQHNIRALIVALGAMVFVTVVIIVGSSIVIRIKISLPVGKIYQQALNGFNNKINLTSKDELGVLATAIDQISEDIKIKADFVKSIGEGDLSRALPLASGDDWLGASLTSVSVPVYFLMAHVNVFTFVLPSIKS